MSGAVAVGVWTATLVGRDGARLPTKGVLGTRSELFAGGLFGCLLEPLRDRSSLREEPFHGLFQYLAYVHTTLLTVADRRTIPQTVVRPRRSSPVGRSGPPKHTGTNPINGCNSSNDSQRPLSFIVVSPVAPGMMALVDADCHGVQITTPPANLACRSRSTTGTDRSTITAVSEAPSRQ